ncbi:leu operon leader peptide [Salmonella enterica subsp. enterica serovar Kentucky]|nr:leu operon leader peptide [Salmonella enterica subsp. enterica serovar Kentucky]
MSHIVRFTGLLLLNAFIVRGSPVSATLPISKKRATL